MFTFFLHKARYFFLLLCCSFFTISILGQEVKSVELDTALVTDRTRLFQRSASDTLLVTERHINAGEMKKIKSEKKFWYADSSFIKKPEQQQEYTPFLDKGWVKTLFWILVILGFTAALIWYLSGSNIGLFKRNKPIEHGSKVAEEMPEDIFAIDYEKEISKALAAGDHRLAVRLKFLALLRDLSLKDIIQYRQNKTNLDYLFQLNTRSYYPDMFRVVRHYEYSWYGRFEVSPRAYELIASDFQKLQQQLN